MSDQDIYDGSWRLWHHDPELGRTVWHMVDEAGNDLFRVDTLADATVEANAADFNESLNQRFPDWARVASIPVGHMFHTGLMEAISQDDKRFVSKFLNDADNRAFRTFRGKV